jgi:hypothetical protein
MVVNNNPKPHVGGYMRRKQNNTLSAKWVSEKIGCINPTARDRAGNIMAMIANAQHFGFLTPEEFAQVLVFKGLAKSVNRFLDFDRNNNTVQETTSIIFENDLRELTFEQTDDNEIGTHILVTASVILNTLSELKYVKKTVASAALTLAYTHLFGTLDYIVPGILHCTTDDRGEANPFIKQIRDKEQFAGCLLLPQDEGMIPHQTRELAKDNYTKYIKERWGIKRYFGLADYRIAGAEMAIWSYGICFDYHSKFLSLYQIVSYHNHNTEVTL